MNYRVRLSFVFLLAGAAITMLIVGIYQTAQITTPFMLTTLMLTTYLVGFLTAISVRK